MVQVNIFQVRKLTVTMTSGHAFQDYTLNIFDSNNAWLQGNGLTASSDQVIISMKLMDTFDHIKRASYMTTGANDHLLKGVSVSDKAMVRVSTGTCSDSMN